MLIYEIHTTVTEPILDENNKEAIGTSVNHTDLIPAPTPTQAMKKLVLPKINEEETLSITITVMGVVKTKKNESIRLKK
jgi:hypothetical protein